MNHSDARQPAVAGQFYEADGKRLEAELKEYFAKAENDPAVLKAAPENGWIARGIISPHAGYMFSGPTAAKTFQAAVSGAAFDRVVVLAPSHRVPFEGLAAPSHKAFHTPLGDIEVDRKALERVMEDGDGVCAILDEAHAYEHALEVQLPFIQTVLPDTPIVPLICGGLRPGMEQMAVKALSSLWGPGNLWVASSDFTHYGASFGYLPFSGPNLPEKLEKLDMGAVKTILALDRDAFDTYLAKTGATICGAAPIKTLLGAAKASGEEVQAKLVEYTNSGALTGDYSHCVGYAGIAMHGKVANQ